MSKYDVYQRGGQGYLLDVQSDLLADFGSRVVVPLLPLNSGFPSAKRLNPVFEVDGNNFIMLTQALAAIPTKELKAPVDNLSDDFDAITTALDMLFQGF